MKIFVFSVVMSLILLHEMDAIRAKEWRMIIGFRSLKDNAAYKLFSLVHLVLYILALTQLLNFGIAHNPLVIIVDILFIAHAVIHYRFRNHAENNLRSVYSVVLIYGLGVICFIDIFVQLLRK